jgi:flagellar biogenesis protein FliO
MGHPVSPLLGAAAKVATIPDVSVGHLLGHTVLALVVIVGGIWGVQKVWSRSKRRGANRPGRTHSGLTVVSRHSLGKDQHLAVVRWGEREVLVGISGSTISFFDDGLGTPLPQGGAEPANAPDAIATRSPRSAGLPTAVHAVTDQGVGGPHRLTPSSFATSLSAVVAQRRGGVSDEPRRASTTRPILDRLRDLTERS